jgi:hypothetical protein
MSTNDVPGANPSNGDSLGMGCWAEHSDGSLMLVESTEASRVIYSMFDMSRDPPIEYRDAMPESSFKKTFSWDPTRRSGPNEKWVWHDKTPFPWDRIIKGGARDGSRLPSADHIASEAERVARSRRRMQVAHFDDDYEDADTAAERVARELRLRGQAFDQRNAEHRIDHVLNRIEDIWHKIKGAVDKLPSTRKPKRGGAARR